MGRRSRKQPCAVFDKSNIKGRSNDNRTNGEAPYTKVRDPRATRTDSAGSYMGVKDASDISPQGAGPVTFIVAAECGRAFPQEKGPVLPAPLVDGGWMDRSVTSEELSAWLRSVLERGGFDVSSISSHSLKHTTLSWAAKWGMDKYIRTLLGHHSTGLLCPRCASSGAA